MPRLGAVRVGHSYPRSQDQSLPVRSGHPAWNRRTSTIGRQIANSPPAQRTRKVWKCSGRTFACLRRTAERCATHDDAVFESVLFRSRGWPRRELKLPRRAHSSLLPISSSKYKDLTELCRKGAVPAAYHQEYYSLRSSASQPDKLDETDEEDDNIEEDKWHELE